MAKKAAEALKEAYDDGYKEGVQVGYVEVLELLEGEYMNRDVERGSVEGEAILEVTRRMGAKLREKKAGL